MERAVTRFRSNVLPVDLFLRTDGSCTQAQTATYWTTLLRKGDHRWRSSALGITRVLFSISRSIFSFDCGGNVSPSLALHVKQTG